MLRLTGDYLSYIVVCDMKATHGACHRERATDNDRISSQTCDSLPDLISVGQACRSAQCRAIATANLTLVQSGLRTHLPISDPGSALEVSTVCVRR